jgi:hypothetical protein
MLESVLMFGGMDYRAAAGTALGAYAVFSVLIWWLQDRREA